jgi:hypothetical protein
MQLSQSGGDRGFSVAEIKLKENTDFGKMITNKNASRESC